MKYDIMHTCGHEYVHNLIGKNSMREWKIEKLSQECCPDCAEAFRKSQIEKENAESAKASEELELVPLQGTEKQIAWANTIRIKFVNFSEKFFDEVLKEISDVEDMKKYHDFVEEIINNSSSKWWIEEGDKYSYDISRKFKLWKHSKEKEAEYAKKKELIDDSMTVIKSDDESVGTVEIIVLDGKIKAAFKKDLNFIEIVKKVGFKWNPDSVIWERKITEKNGGTDRLIELAVRLLEKGFSIKVDNGFVDDIKSSNYEPECKNWIRFDEESNRFVFYWDNSNDSMYHEIRKISGSKYESGLIYVPERFASEVYDFAKINNFRFTRITKEYFEMRKSPEVKVEKVEIKEKENIEDLRNNMLNEVLLSSSDVLEDLIDEDEEPFDMENCDVIINKNSNEVVINANTTCSGIIRAKRNGIEYIFNSISKDKFRCDVPNLTDDWWEDVEEIIYEPNHQVDAAPS